MVREAILIYDTAFPINFTVADNTGIEKGAILKVTDPRTAALSVGTNDIVAGIAATEKIVNNGQTQLGVLRKGVFRMSLSGSCTVGDRLATYASTLGNYVGTVNANMALSGSQIIGIALETGAADETILVEVGII